MTDYLLILGLATAVTVYFTSRRIVSLKSILFLLSSGMVFLLLQFAYGVFVVSDYDSFDSITLWDVLFLELGPYNRLMLMSYTMFASAIACSFVLMISTLLGKDVGAGCAENNDEENDSSAEGQ